MEVLSLHEIHTNCLNTRVNFHTTFKYFLPLLHYLVPIDMDIRLKLFYHQHLNNS